MMLKKFSGPNTREALKKLREELGEDAVILSTKQTAAGAEILAALADDLPQLPYRQAVFIVGKDLHGAGKRLSGNLPE